MEIEGWWNVSSDAKHLPSKHEALISKPRTAKIHLHTHTHTHTHTHFQLYTETYLCQILLGNKDRRMIYPGQIRWQEFCREGGWIRLREEVMVKRGSGWMVKKE
jgi:hypothetical protein